MSDVWAVVSLGCLLGAAWWQTRMLCPRGRVEGALAAVLLLSTAIVLLGYLLSAAHLLARVAWWAAGSAALLAVTLAVGLAVPALRARCCRPARLPRDIEARIAAAPRGYATRLLALLGLTLLGVALLDFIVIITFEPSSLDVLGYHLARIAFYLQQGHLGDFPADYWAQIVHPKIATVLTLYAFLVSGMLGNLAALVQFAAFLTCVAALYGTARALGARRQGSAFAAGLFALLIIAIMQAATMQNDLLLTAFVAIAVYELAAYRAAPRARDLALAALALALAAGVKSSVVAVLPSLLVVAGFALRGARARDLGVGALALALGVAALTLPAGYWHNSFRYGHPIGPAAIRAKHAFEGRAPRQILVYGGENLLRYGLHFLALDGLPDSALIERAQAGLRWLPRRVIGALGISLADPGGVRTPYRGDDVPQTNEDQSYWGPVGWLLIWPAVLALALGAWRAPGTRVFALAALVFVLAQAFISPYDWFRGRYFLTAAVFALPPLAFLPLPPRSALGRAYLAGAVTLCCAVALCAGLLRHGTRLVPFTRHGQWFPPTFTLGRLHQLTRERTDLTPLLLTYESETPAHAVVALDLPTDHFLPEYLFFGERLGRHVAPLHPFQAPARPCPPDADVLIFAAGAVPPRPRDIPLCRRHALYGTVYLRHLKPAE